MKHWSVPLPSVRLARESDLATEDSADTVGQREYTLAHLRNTSLSPGSYLWTSNGGPTDYQASFGNGVVCQVVLRKWRKFDLAPLVLA